MPTAPQTGPGAEEAISLTSGKGVLATSPTCRLLGLVGAPAEKLAASRFLARPKDVDIDINLNITYTGHVSDEQALGGRIRELRLKHRLSQRALAELVAQRLDTDKRRGFDFTYLSKIENNRLIPSAAVILEIATVLQADSDELLALARKAPPDMTEALAENEGARMFLRSALAKGLTDEDWKVLLRRLEKRKP